MVAHRFSQGMHADCCFEAFVLFRCDRDIGTMEFDRRPAIVEDR